MTIPLRLLAVEDSENDARLILRALRAGGYDVTTERVETADAMRAALARGPWDLVISDFRMPTFTGMEALDVLHASGDDVPFILISGTIGEDVAVSAMKAGAHDYLMKDNLTRLVPAVQRELHEAVERRARRTTDAALRVSHDRARAVTESAYDSIITGDAAGNVISWNAAAERLFGYTAAEMIGRPLTMVMPAKHRDAHREGMERVASGGAAHIIGRSVEVSALTKAGDEIAIELSLAQWRTADEICFTGMIRDISERKRSEDALRLSEARFRVIFEQSPLGVAVIDSVTGRFIDVNVRFAQIAGRTSAALRDMDWMRITHPDDVAEDQNHMSAMNGGVTSGFSRNKRYVRPDGSCVWINMTIAPLTGGDPAHQWHLCMIDDITAHREAEEALRESEFRWKFAIEGAGEGLWDWNVPTGTVFFSTRWKAMLGYAEDDIGNSLDEWKSRLHPDDAPRVMADLAGLLDGSRPNYRCEHRVRCKDGSWLWILDRGTVLSRDANGKAVRVIGTHMDYTQQRRNEEQLRLEGGALEAAANTIIITDAAGVIIWTNAAFSTLTGYTASEALGKRPGELLKSGTQAPAFYQQMWSTILAGNVWADEIVNRRKDGTHYSAVMTITPLKNPSGVTTHFVAVKQDITQRKLLEAQYRQSHKMESVGRLAGGIAHDFNNMLSVILGRAELALRLVDERQPLHSHLLEVEQAALRSANLTRQLLAFARKEVVTPRALDINASIGEALKMLRRLIGENIRLDWNPAPASWHIMMDPSQLDQILANLCVNARDAIKTTGTLTIATDNILVDASYRMKLIDAAPGEYVRLTVRDSGCGMTAEVQSHLFEPFFTTKSVGEGTGLGLSTVFGAVQQNNGFIHVESEVGHGTTFELYFPRLVAPAHETPSAGVPVVAATGGHETILLVEDETMVLRMTASMLKAHGYAVLQAIGPAEALKLAQASAGTIDLLITDVVMPQMNGRALATMLVARQPQLKVLFMSAYAAGIEGITETGDNPSAFIGKPFTVDALVAKVREVLDHVPA